MKTITNKALLVLLTLTATGSALGGFPTIVSHLKLISSWSKVAASSIFPFVIGETLGHLASHCYLKSTETNNLIQTKQNIIIRKRKAEGILTFTSITASAITISVLIRDVMTSGCFSKFLNS